MINKAPKDYVHLWSLDQIGRLDKYAFTAVVTSPYVGAYTICFWFYAVSTDGKQVLANHGNKSTDQEGWSVFIEDGYLVFRVNIEGIQSSDIQVQIQPFGLLYDIAISPNSTFISIVQSSYSRH